jgi:hypothetical protein
MRKKSTPVVKMKAQKKISKFDVVGDAVERKVLEIKRSSKDQYASPENKSLSILFGHFA